jgi:hypothetical protein
MTPRIRMARVRAAPLAPQQNLPRLHTTTYSFNCWRNRPKSGRVTMHSTAKVATIKLAAAVMAAAMAVPWAFSQRARDRLQRRASPPNGYRVKATGSRWPPPT